MRRLTAPVLACLLLAACAGARDNVATLPPSFFGVGVYQDDAAMYEARLAFGGNQPFPTDAAKAARVLAVYEFMTGELTSNGTYSDLSGIVQAQLQQGRKEIRAALGVPDETPAQPLVDALVAVSQTNDPSLQRAALGSPIFTMGADATLARLRAMPPLPRASRAIVEAGRADNRLSTRF